MLSRRQPQDGCNLLVIEGTYRHSRKSERRGLKQNVLSYVACL